MTAVVQVLVDVLAIVGGWHSGGYLGRAVRQGRGATASPVQNRTPEPVPWQYQPVAFEPIHNGRTMEKGPTE